MILVDNIACSFKNAAEVEAFCLWFLRTEAKTTGEFATDDEYEEFIKQRNMVLHAQLVNLVGLEVPSAIETQIAEQSFYRIVPASESKPLSADGSLRSNSRFNYKNSDEFRNRAIYFGQDRDCCYIEKFHLDIQKANYARLFSRTPEQQQDELPRPQYVLKEYRIENIQKIAVLTSDSTFKAMGIVTSVARDEWYPVNDRWEIPTAGQLLGTILRKSGFNGVLYTSVRNQSKNNLVLFEDNLGRLEFEEVSSIDLDMAITD